MGLLYDSMVPHLRQVFENAASDEQIRAFQKWETQSAARMLVRYADLPVASAFGLKASDVVTVDDRITFEIRDSGTRLYEAGRYIGTLANTPAALLKSFLATLDGRRSFAAICSEQPFADHAYALASLVEALLGRPFLIPASIAELEEQLPAIEVLRFPTQSPYAMPRQYWENSIAVRDALESFYERLRDLGAFTHGLRGLHRLATIGVDGSNYYGGAGGIATVPGELRTTSIGNLFDERKTWILARWLELLDVRYQPASSGWIVSTRNVPLVHIADDGHRCHHPYGRAGEQLANQLDEMRLHLSEARAAVQTGRERLLRHCALFHQCFALAHPFANINNSIAMNIVNDLLGRAGIGVLPHLYLDLAAYLSQPEDYVRLFERAVEAHVMNDSVGRDRPATRALLEAVASAPAA